MYQSTYIPSPNIAFTTPGYALVTGASSGVGQAAAIALSSAGWTCMLVARREELLQETLKVMTDRGGSKGDCVLAADLSKLDQVLKVFEEIKTRFGRLDLVFNNAGMGSPRIPIEDLTPEQYEKVMLINVFAPFWITQESFKIMKNQTPIGGRIINNGSISAHTPRTMSAPYTMSKHAVLGLTKAAALDGREFNIAVSELDIGNAEAFSGKFKAMPQPNGTVQEEPSMHIDYTGHAIVYMASLPLSVNNLSQILIATGMPFVGRG